MPTALRASLRTIADEIERRNYTSAEEKARALADAPATVAELLSLVDETHEVHANRGDVAFRFRLHRSARVPMPPVDTIVVERCHQGAWWPTRMLPSDLTAHAQLVEVG